MASVREITTEVALPFLATLKRGSTYWLCDLVFEKGVPVPVSDDQMAHLQEFAGEDRLRYVDDETGEPEIERVNYFEFIPNPAATVGAAS